MSRYACKSRPRVYLDAASIRIGPLAHGQRPRPMSEQITETMVIGYLQTPSKRYLYIRLPFQYKSEIFITTINAQRRTGEPREDSGTRIIIENKTVIAIKTDRKFGRYRK
ncbi:hypothetical protein EVAR_36779_1 [Eumeta japonica]|uniref:Uncharacterized protein n=1 Tax=Eumeta variegata TaxID=151549 RepID=A0A4C1X0A7_EUMVA|nr:hypothetical protein EVAR_36779_1 [Eumeta japonica]